MRRTNSKRANKMADQIKQELSRIIVEESNDPGLNLLSITGVRMNRDFSIAEVLYTHIDGKKKQKEIEKSLARAKGFFKSRIASRLQLRHMPDLRFAWDTFLEEMIYE